MDQDILSKIQDTLAGALGVEKDEVKPEASLTNDLGAESIDFIDIIFRLEKTFNIKIPSGDLFPGNLLNDEKMVQGGRVTEQGLKELTVKLPYLDIEAFSKDPQVTKLGDFFTVQMIVRYLENRLTTETSES